MKHLDVAVALILRGERWFLQRREQSSRTFPGHWEFPGGKLEHGEDAQGALYRELEEELRWAPASLQALPLLEFHYPDRPLRLHPFRCEGGGLLHAPSAWGWFLPAEARRLALPGASRALLDSLAG
jgi:8-oxo-dGTP diphosphatase